MRFTEFFLSVMLFFSVGMLNACYYDNEEELYNSGNTATCDTTNVTYSGKVLPLLQSDCLGCHGNLSANAIGGGYNLEGYDNLLPVAQDNLYCVINHDSGCSPMPKGTAKMSDCNVSIIKKWIDDGAPNN